MYHHTPPGLSWGTLSHDREIFLSDSTGSQLLRSAEETVLCTEKAWEHLLGLEDEDRIECACKQPWEGKGSSSSLLAGKVSPSKPASFLPADFIISVF